MSTPDKGWSIHFDHYDPDETYMGEISGYDPVEDTRESFEDWLAGAGFFPHDPADGPDTRRADYLNRTGYAS